MFSAFVVTGCSTEAQLEKEYLDQYVKTIDSYSQKTSELFKKGEAKSSQGVDSYSKGETETAKQVFSELVQIIDDTFVANKQARTGLKKLVPPSRMKKLHRLTLESLDAWRKFMEKDRQYVQSYVNLKPDEKLRDEALKQGDIFQKINKEVQAEFAKVTK